MIIGKCVCCRRDTACRDSVSPFHQVSFCEVWVSWWLSFYSSAPCFHQCNHYWRRQHTGGGMIHTNTHLHANRTTLLLASSRWSFVSLLHVCVTAAVAGCNVGKRGSIFADAHTIRHHKDRGEATYNHSHTAAAIKQSKGEKEVCRKWTVISSLVCSTSVLYETN